MYWREVWCLPTPPIICNLLQVRDERLLLMQVKTRGALSCCTYFGSWYEGHWLGKHFIEVSPLLLPTQLNLSYVGLFQRHYSVTDTVHIILLCRGGKVENFPGSELCFLWHWWPLGRSLFICELTASPKPRKQRGCIPPDHWSARGTFMRRSEGI